MNNYFLIGDINSNSISSLLDWLSNLEFTNTGNLYISSGGGELDITLAAIDFMNLKKSQKITINTIGMGSVCSSAALLLCSGTSVSVFKDTHIMTHAFSIDESGSNYHSLKSATKFHDLSMERMYKVFTDRGIEKSVVKRKILKESDCWFTAHEALDLKIIDKICKF